MVRHEIIFRKWLEVVDYYNEYYIKNMTYKYDDPPSSKKPPQMPPVLAQKPGTASDALHTFVLTQEEVISDMSPEDMQILNDLELFQKMDDIGEAMIEQDIGDSFSQDVLDTQLALHHISQVDIYDAQCRLDDLIDNPDKRKKLSPKFLQTSLREHIVERLLAPYNKMLKTNPASVLEIFLQSAKESQLPKEYTDIIESILVEKITHALSP